MRRKGFNPGRNELATRKEVLAMIDQAYDLSLEQIPVREIADRLGLTRATAYRYIDFARKRFHRKTQKKAELKRSESLAEFQKIKRELYLEWHRSKLNAESESEEISEVNGKYKSKIRSDKKGRIGDANLMSRIIDCIKEEIKLFGLPIPPVTDIQLEEMVEKDPAFVRVENREEYLQFEELKNDLGSRTK